VDFNHVKCDSIGCEISTVQGVDEFELCEM
jgi:hypothetical protein